MLNRINFLRYQIDRTNSHLEKADWKEHIGNISLLGIRLVTGGKIRIDNSQFKITSYPLILRIATTIAMIYFYRVVDNKITFGLTAGITTLGVVTTACSTSRQKFYTKITTDKSNKPSVKPSTFKSASKSISTTAFNSSNPTKNPSQSQPPISRFMPQPSYNPISGLKSDDKKKESEKVMSNVVISQKSVPSITKELKPPTASNPTKNSSVPTFSSIPLTTSNPISIKPADEEKGPEKVVSNIVISVADKMSNSTKGIIRTHLDKMLHVMNIGSTSTTMTSVATNTVNSTYNLKFTNYGIHDSNSSNSSSSSSSSMYQAYNPDAASSSSTRVANPTTTNTTTSQTRNFSTRSSSYAVHDPLVSNSSSSSYQYNNPAPVTNSSMYQAYPGVSSPSSSVTQPTSTYDATKPIIDQIDNLIKAAIPPNVFLPNNSSLPPQVETHLDVHFSKNDEGDLWVEVSLQAKTSEAELAHFISESGMDYIISLDVSASMDGEKIILAKKAIENLIGTLTPNDRVCITTFGKTTKVIMPFTLMTGDGKATATRLITKDTILEGSTNMQLSLLFGMSLALHMKEFSNQERPLFQAVITDGASNDVKVLNPQVGQSYKAFANGIGVPNYTSSFFGIGLTHSNQEDYVTGLISFSNIMNGFFCDVKPEDISKVKDLRDFNCKNYQLPLIKISYPPKLEQPGKKDQLAEDFTTTYVVNNETSLWGFKISATKGGLIDVTSKLEYTDLLTRETNNKNVKKESAIHLVQKSSSKMDTIIAYNDYKELCQRIDHNLESPTKPLSVVIEEQKKLIEQFLIPNAKEPPPIEACPVMSSLAQMYRCLEDFKSVNYKELQQKLRKFWLKDYSPLHPSIEVQRIVEMAKLVNDVGRFYPGTATQATNYLNTPDEKLQADAPCYSLLKEHLINDAARIVMSYVRVSTLVRPSAMGISYLSISKVSISKEREIKSYVVRFDPTGTWQLLENGTVKEQQYQSNEDLLDKFILA